MRPALRRLPVRFGPARHATSPRGADFHGAPKRVQRRCHLGGPFPPSAVVMVAIEIEGAWLTLHVTIPHRPIERALVLVRSPQSEDRPGLRVQRNDRLVDSIPLPEPCPSTNVRWGRACGRQNVLRAAPGSTNIGVSMSCG